eukprot:scaffold31156_cov28-Prasinocladus_malaysianus.AAC.1
MPKEAACDAKRIDGISPSWQGWSPRRRWRGPGARRHTDSVRFQEAWRLGVSEPGRRQTGCLLAAEN